MSAARTDTELPTVEAVRRPPRTMADPPTWRIRKCPYCRRPHVHAAGPADVALVLPARCGHGRRFYRVTEVAA